MTSPNRRNSHHSTTSTGSISPSAQPPGAEPQLSTAAPATSPADARASAPPPQNSDVQPGLSASSSSQAADLSAKQHADHSQPAGRRLAAFGTELIEVHQWLRDELARLREEVDAYLERNGARPRDLRSHCLAFCSALERHHTGEDAAVFPLLARQFPELREVLEELGRDHHVVSGLLRQLQAVVDDLDRDPQSADPRRVRAELDGLAALVESHFTYEERRIVSALNELVAPDWHESTPDFLQTST
ncbi:hemerythrin domain-containing protein [Nonomuraea sp. NPDC050310]|uniref:hemerythrin domain-containing protein n=1 Tax=Nonomuraea sp. NPDC050310 TaxID=3154935 RepID=UPI0033F47BE0